MNTLKNYQIESSFDRFELRLEDDFLQRTDISADPSMFKHLCIALSNQIVHYEEAYSLIDIAGTPSAKSSLSPSYDQKDLISYQFDFTSGEFKFALKIKSFMSSEDYVLKAAPAIAKWFVIECANAIVQYEESYGTIAL